MTDLYPEWRVGEVVLTDAPYSVPFGSTAYGTPENVTQLIRAMLDGDIEVTSRAGNRDVTLPVFIDDSDLAALAEAERVLELECRKARNEVYVDPGDGFAEPFLFDVFRGQLSFERNDDFERAGFRAYSLTFRARPFVRSVDEVTLEPTPTNIGTARQKSYAFDVAGSARTEAGIHVGTSGTALGETLIYTRPGAAHGMIPLRQYRTSGSSTTISSTLVSGAYDGDLSTPTVATVPVADVPEGTYIVLALVRTSSGSGDTTITVGASVDVAGFPAVASVTPMAQTVFVDTDYSFRQIGSSFQLPVATLADEADAEIVLTLSETASGLTVRLDEWWLVEIGSGSLTWPDFKTDAKHVWIEPSTPTRPYKRLLRGTEPDRSDAYHLESFFWATHVLEPGANTALLVTVSSASAALEVPYWPRWHTHAGLVS